MVGVAGKSRGCGTCRARKIACGQERPVCAQCIKSNRACAGYERKKTFVLVQPGEKNSRRTVLKDEPELASSSQSSGDTTASADDENDTQLSLLEQGSCSEIISKSNFRQQIFDSFLGLGPSRERLGFHGGHNKPWLFMLPELPMTSRLLQSSTLALATAALGQRLGDPFLIRESLKLYTRGLRELQSALWSPNRMRDDDTLAACLALSCYEVMECPDNGPAAFDSHRRGLLSLIRARGIDAHTSGVGHELFLGVRFQGILLALGNHDPNYLSDPLWMEGPWESRSKRVMDLITDCLAQAPAIFQRSDQLKLLGPLEGYQLAQQLIYNCWEIDRQLTPIYDEIKLEVHGPLYWLVLSKAIIEDTDGHTLFPVAYQFPDLRTASMLMLYWATTTMLWSGMKDLYDYVEMVAPAIFGEGSLTDTTEGTASDEAEASSPFSFGLPPLGHRRDIMVMARNVCQSIEYCLQEEMSIIGTFTVSTPIGMVIGSIQGKPQHSREYAWLRRVQEQIQTRGLRILKYMGP